jgi:hypothetical protein
MQAFYLYNLVFSARSTTNYLLIEVVKMNNVIVPKLSRCIFKQSHIFLEVRHEAQRYIVTVVKTSLNNQRISHCEVSAH